MKIKDVKDYFFEHVGAFNERYGFSSKKSTFKLVKKTEYGSIVIDFTYNSYYQKIELIPCLNVYHKNISDIAKKCIPGTNPAVAMYMIYLRLLKEKGERAIRKAAGTGELYWNIKEDTYQEDILQAIRDLEYIYENYGKDEVERFRSIEEIYKLFRNKPKKHSYYHTVWQYKAIFGLITAKVLRKDDYEKLKKIYYKTYQKEDQLTLGEFECLMDVLDNLETDQ